MYWENFNIFVNSWGSLFVDIFAELSSQNFTKSLEAS